MTNLKIRARGGEQIAGAFIFEFFTPGVPRIAAAAGAEFAIYDMEHSGASIETMKWMAAASRGAGVVPMARAPIGEYTWLSRLLDVGMGGVMAPMVESGEAASRLVEACRYPPIGRRGAAFGFAADDYRAVKPAEKMARDNDGVLVIAQVESERGVENIDAIAGTEGVDMIWIGQADLSNFLGVPGQLDSQIYQDAWKTICDGARRHGKLLGAMAVSPEINADYRAQGFEMIAAGTDPGILTAGLKAIMEGGK